MAVLRIWSNANLSEQGRERLAAATAAHQLTHVDAAPSDPADLGGFDVAFGQPNPEACAQSKSLRW